MKREVLALIICIFANNLAFSLDLVPPAEAYDPSCLKITKETEACPNPTVKKVESYAADRFGVNLKDPTVNIVLPNKNLFPYDLKYNLKENTWRLRLFQSSSTVLVNRGLIEPTITYDNTERYRLYLINKGIAF
ncbi:MAG: hypothetical protein WC405_20970 [Syntrophales bacterium]